ncbi:MAG: hypothetical protein ABFD97_13720 [Syntrophobacter sp.]
MRSPGAAVILPSLLFMTGLLVLSPSAGFILMVLTAIFAIIPSFRGRGAVRIIGIALLILSIAFSVSYYPQFRSEQREFIQKGRQVSD